MEKNSLKVKKIEKEKERICYICNENIAGESGMISMDFDGLKFTIHKRDIECADCARKAYIEIFEEYRKLVKLKDGEIKVDWEFYVKNLSKDDFLKMTTILELLGILSHESEGNWEISHHGLFLNPNYRFFTRREDALIFSLVECKNVSCEWEIRQIKNVIHKSEALENAKKIVKKSGK